MVMCFAPDCNHYSERGECKKFFRFPTNPKEKQRWIKLLSRQDRLPSQHSLVCSCHFKNNDKLEGPTIFKRNVDKQLSFDSPTKRKRLIKAAQVIEVEVKSEIFTEEAGPSGLQSSTPLKHSSLEKHKSLVQKKGFPKQESLPHETTLPQQESVSQQRYHREHSSSCNPKTKVKLRCPTFAALLAAENYFLIQKVENLVKEMKIRFTFDRIKHSDSLISMYTGIPTINLFEILFELMSRFELNYYGKWPKPCVVQGISRKDQLLLTLMKLRMNLWFEDLAVCFSISRTTVTSIFFTWLHALHEVLFQGFMDNIPSREKNRMCLPASFNVSSNCKIILDCIEVPAIHSKNMYKQKLTNSAYKHRNTLKGLIGVAPNGAVTFASDLYPGSVSDEKITQHCRITKSLVAGDLVLTDKGFLIQDCVPQGVVVNVPPFLNTPQFSTEQQVIITRTSACARIRVERAIRRIKCFRILNLVPATLMPHASVVFQVCAALTNLQFPLIKEEQYKEG